MVLITVPSVLGIRAITANPFPPKTIQEGELRFTGSILSDFFKINGGKIEYDNKGRRLTITLDIEAIGSSFNTYLENRINDENKSRGWENSHNEFSAWAPLDPITLSVNRLSADNVFQEMRRMEPGEKRTVQFSEVFADPRRYPNASDSNRNAAVGRIMSGSGLEIRIFMSLDGIKNGQQAGSAQSIRLQ